MAGIFISYRRDDGSGYTGRIYDHLVKEFGRELLFMDVDNLEPGLDFVEAIERAVGSCDALVAVIGQRWLTSTNERGQRRLDHPEDFVRLEIAAALARDVRVIPVLVGGAQMPRFTDLPENLQPLSHRQALNVSDERFLTDTTRLIKTLQQEIETDSLLQAVSNTETSQADIAGKIPGISDDSPHPMTPRFWPVSGRKATIITLITLAIAVVIVFVIRQYLLSSMLMDLGGDWEISDDNFDKDRYRAKFIQIGNRVYGSYDRNYMVGESTVTGTGTFEGNIVERKNLMHLILELEWKQSYQGGKSGTADLTISSDGKELKGPWFYNPKTGQPPAGTWYFKKIKIVK